MEEVITYTDYSTFKRDLDAELQKTAESFVRIGYLLKVARDTGILEESGYRNVNEFAKAEYNIDETQVSRFININNRFSEGGYSASLKEQYKGFGYAKLSIMLTLPDVINEELTPDFTKKDIQAIQSELKEEQKVSDLEVMMEDKDGNTEEMSFLQKILYQLCKENPEFYRTLYESVKLGMDAAKTVNALAPAGAALHTIRIPGAGRYMLSIKEEAEKISIINARSQEKEEYPKGQAWIEIVKMMEEDTPEASWERLYEEPWPLEEKKAEPAASKPEQKPKKPERVTKAKNPEPKKPDKSNKDEKKAGIAPVQPEEQLPGQMEVEDYPEMMPEEEADAREEEPEKGDKVESRKAYLNSLSAREAALYISEYAKKNPYFVFNLRNAEAIEAWYLKQVDNEGKEINHEQS